MPKRIDASRLRGRDALVLTAPVEITAGAATDGAPAVPRFAMHAYTGGLMRLAYWRHPVVVDLSGVRTSAKARPILRDHDPARVVGHTDQIEVDATGIRVTGLVSGAGPDAQEIVATSGRGFPWQASIGAAAERVELLEEGKQARVNGQAITGPAYIVRAAALKEVSFVALGADDHTSATVAATDGGKEWEMEFSAWLKAKGFDLDTLTEAQLASLQAMFDAEQAEDAPAPAEDGVQAGDPAPAPAPDEDPVATLRANLAAETQRVAQVRRICAGQHAEIEAQAIAEGWDATRTELEVLRASRPKAPAVGSRDRGSATAHALTAALCLSAGLPEKVVAAGFDDATMSAALSRDLRGAGLHMLLYEAIRANGGYVAPGRLDNEAIRLALHLDPNLRGGVQASAGFSTISLSGILGNVANKAMLAAYQAVASVVGQFCDETDTNDFRQFTRYRLTGKGLFEEVGPGGELKQADLDEESYTNQLTTKGTMLALTRQMMINDDLGAFLQIPRIIGRMAALAREEAVFKLLLANPGNFFAVANRNYKAGATTALTIDALTEAEQMFLDQVDKDGRPILITPKLCLVPTSLKVAAERLFSEARVNETTTADKAKPADNPHAGKFRPVTSPYLNSAAMTGNSAKAWYLFADPSDVPALQIAYLRGQRTPVIESAEANFNVLGVQWRGYHDFGVGMQDPRGAVKFKGEA